MTVPGSPTTTAGPPARTAPDPPPVRPRRPASVWLRLLVLFGVALALASPLLLAWGRSRIRAEDHAAVEAAEQFLNAVHKRDAQEIKHWVTKPEANPTVPPELQADGVRGFEVELPRIEGDEARAPFTLRGGVPKGAVEGAQLLTDPRGVVHLRRVGKVWRVHALTFPADEAGNGPGFDLETTPFSPLGATDSVQDFEAMAALDAGRFAALWQTELDVRDRPAGRVLGELAAAVGLTLVPPGNDLRDRPVRLRLGPCSRLEAIDAVSRQLGRHPEYQGSQVTLQPGPAPLPVAYAGPFRVQAEQVREFSPNPTGVLVLRCVAPRLPAAVSALTLADPGESPTYRATAADGTDLYQAENQAFYPPPHAPEALSFGTFVPALYGAYQETRFVPLRNLLRELDSVHEVRGRLRLTLPARVDELVFEGLTAGTVREAGGVRLALLQSVPMQMLVAGPARQGLPGAAPWQPRTGFDFEARGLGDRLCRWLATDARGNPVPSAVEKLPEAGRFRLVAAGEPTRVRCKVLTRGDVVSYDFALRDVPLRGRQPRRLEPLQFPGHETPVTLGASLAPAAGEQPAVGGLPRKPGMLRLQVHNHSTKSVEWVRFRLAYRDAAGRVLKDVAESWPRFNVQPYAYPGQAGFGPQAPAGAIWVADLEPAQPVPKGTADMALTVTAVGFADGTTWSAERR